MTRTDNVHEFLEDAEKTKRRRIGHKETLTEDNVKVKHMEIFVFDLTSHSLCTYTHQVTQLLLMFCFYYIQNDENGRKEENIYFDTQKNTKQTGNNISNPNVVTARINRNFKVRPH
jgi:hypothetical protein